MMIIVKLRKVAADMIEFKWDSVSIENSNFLLCAYPDGIWICDTNGFCEFVHVTKLDLVTSDTWIS